MKKYFIILSLLFFSVSCSPFGQKNIYGTYCYYSDTYKKTLQNWTSLTINADGTFTLKIPYINSGESIYGTWLVKNDSLFLNTEYSYQDVNIIPQKNNCKSGFVQLNIKIYLKKDNLYSDYQVALYLEALNNLNDTQYSCLYYEMDNNNTIYVPYDTILKAKRVALYDKEINYPVYQGLIRQEAALFKDSYEYDIVFMGVGSYYPVKINDCFIFENDTLKKIIQDDETGNLTIKYAKTTHSNVTDIHLRADTADL